MGTAAWGQTLYNLGSKGSNIYQEVNDGVYFKEGGTPGATGTGMFDPFYRLNGGSTVQGVNTGNPNVQFDTQANKWTTSLLLSSVTQVVYDGVLYREFFLDVNQPGSSGTFDLVDVQLYTDDQSNLNCLNPATRRWDQAGAWCGSPNQLDTEPLAELIFWLDDGGNKTIVIPNSTGSGKDDVTMLVPDALFPSGCDFGAPDCDVWVYLYSKFEGAYGGFEEWATAIAPYVTVAKTIVGTANDEITWEITKTVDPDEWDLFKGDSGTSEYKVKVTPTTVAGDAEISGTITVCVPSTLPDGETKSVNATVTALTDVFEGDPAVVNCPAAFPFTINAGNCVVCTYTLDLDSPKAGTNTATAVVAGAGTTFSGTALIAAGDYVPQTQGDESVNVTDTNGQSWGPVSVVTEWTYTKTFTCDADDGTNNNTAEITETAQEASASVEVNCYDLVVTKDASTSKKSTWEWEIEKTAFYTEGGAEVVGPILVPKGSSTTVHYEVELSIAAGFPVESDWSVEGDITVSNPAPMAAKITAVADVISPAIAATVDCGAAVFPYTLAAGGDLECSYSADLPDGTTRTNTATATLQNYDYDKALVATASGTTAFTGTASVNFASATVNAVDDCVDVDDTYEGVLGEVCYGDAPYSFHYDREIQAGEVDCTEFNVENTASFETNDTEATGSDAATVLIEVPCEGCTYTQGYWKTHNESFKGGASKKADPTWCVLTACEQEEFYGSGMSYFEVMWTPPSGGNAYYQLAHQYIAAWLNCNNVDEDLQPDCTIIETELADAEALFAACGPNDVAKDDATCDSKAFRDLASTLGDFNEGIIGPGHCGDEEEYDEEKDGEKALKAEKGKKVGPGANTSESDETEATYTPATVGTPAVTPDSEGRAVSEVPNAFGIANYPNPFNPQTTISIAVPELSHVSVAIFDVMGRFVAQLVDGSMPAGTHNITWSAEQLPSGTYFLMMRAGEFAQTRQMTLLR